MLKAMLHENCYNEIHGRVLLIGKSTVAVNYQYIVNIFQRYSLAPPLKNHQHDKKTKHSSEAYFLDDVQLVSSLSNRILQIDVLDVSDYEGASIVCDLNYPVPEIYLSQFDFIYDSGVLDNLFNPAQAICNIAKMLKPSGRYLGINVASFFPGALCSCHPEWFYGFFSTNKFADVKTYLMEQVEFGLNRFEFETDLFHYKPTFTRQANYNYLEAVKNTNGVCFTLVVAEAPAIPVQDIRYPINLHYIASSKADDWSKNEILYCKSPRPLMQDEILFERHDTDRQVFLPHNTDHYEYLGTGF